jgi:hypothetical protein
MHILRATKLLFSCYLLEKKRLKLYEFSPNLHQILVSHVWFILYTVCFLVLSCLVHSSTLKTEAVCSSETSVDFYQTTWHYTPEDSTLHNHQCENLKSKRNFSYPKHLNIQNFHNYLNLVSFLLHFTFPSLYGPYTTTM